MHAFNSFFSHQWFMTNQPAPHICHCSGLDAANVDKSNHSGLCWTLHLEPFGCWPLVSTRICLFNEDRRLLASSLLNSHLFFMPVSLHLPPPTHTHSDPHSHSPASDPPRPCRQRLGATHMTSARMKSDRRSGRRRANCWNWLNRLCV